MELSEDGKILIEGDDISHFVIPDGVETIGEHAFDSFSSLTSVTIPESVTIIGEHAFDGCSSLYSIKITDGVKIKRSKLIMKLSDDGNVLVKGENEDECILPDSINRIGELAFYGCSSLESIMIPCSVNKIGYAAFWECSSLESVTIPESVTKIAKWGFLNCFSLTTVTLYGEVPPTLGKDVFKYWDGRKFRFIDGLLIYVPAGAVTAYKEADGWCAYADRIRSNNENI